MKKKIKKLSALVLALVLVFPFQIMCVFAEETNIQDKFQPYLWEYLQEVEDENEKIPVMIHLVEPDYSGLSEKVDEKFGEFLEHHEYENLYGEISYNDWFNEYVMARHTYHNQLKIQLHREANEKFMDEAGLSYDDLIIDELGGAPFIFIYLTKEEIFELAKNEKVVGLYYHNTAPDVTDIEYVEELMIGDVNKDGKVTPMDAYLVQRYLVGYGEFTPQQKLYLADVTNSDVPKGASNAVTTVDVLEILRYTVGYASDTLVGTMELVPIYDETYKDPDDMVEDSDLDVIFPE